MELLGRYSNWASWADRTRSLLNVGAGREHVTHRDRVAVRKLSRNEVSELVAHYRAGATVYDLGERFGIHRATVSAHLHREGVKVRGCSMTVAEVDQSVTMYGHGLSVERIGEQLGFNGGTVWLALRARGVRLRDAQGRER